MKEDLKAKINQREAVIGIFGLGYVGLPLVCSFIDAGFKVIGVDVDDAKVEALNKGSSYIDHISDRVIADVVAKGFVATTDFSTAKQMDALIICVPTPLNKYREPNLKFVISTVESITPYIRKDQLLSLESTTYPGTTDEELAPRISRTGMSLGEDYFLVYSPEREDPGNENFTTRSIPKICGGYTENCLDVGVTLYKTIIDKVVSVSSTSAAEMTKLLENIHRAVNIGLVNEMKIVADRMDLNIHEIIDAAKTKPFGFTAYYPGPGLGGHCIPIDPFYLTWKAREYGLHTRFIELAGEINASMPRWVVNKLVEALNENSMSLKGAKILVLGIAYKKNVDDMRESPAVEIMELLTAKAAEVDYSDPYVPVFPKMRKHEFDSSSVELTEENLKKYDAVIIATDHDNFDYQLILDNASLIIDSRGRFSGKTHKNIIRA